MSRGQSPLLCVCVLEGVGDMKESLHKRAIRTSAERIFY